MLFTAQCREITNGVAPEPFRWTAEALLAMQEVRTAAGCLSASLGCTQPPCCHIGLAPVLQLSNK